MISVKIISILDHDADINKVRCVPATRPATTALWRVPSTKKHHVFRSKARQVMPQCEGMGSVKSLKRIAENTWRTGMGTYKCQNVADDLLGNAYAYG